MPPATSFVLLLHGVWEERRESSADDRGDDLRKYRFVADVQRGGLPSGYILFFHKLTLGVHIPKNPEDGIGRKNNCKKELGLFKIIFFELADARHAGHPEYKANEDEESDRDRSYKAKAIIKGLQHRVCALL